MRYLIVIRIVTLGFGLLAVPGCSTYGFKTPIGENTYPPVDYRKVTLLFGAPARPYEVIGVVSTQGGIFATEGDMDQKLIKSAAVLGADAVIVTGEGNRQVLFPGSSSTTVNASSYGNYTTATANTIYTSDYIANMPTNKGLAIKFTK